MGSDYFDISDELKAAKAVLVSIDSGNQNMSNNESLEELARLADTANIEIVGTLTQKLDSPHPRLYVGTGKVQELDDLVKAMSANVVICDDEISPTQQQNLEKALGKKIAVMDRTELILDIFALHAITREGKLQVELATLQYELPRLKGLWSHLEKEKLGGGVGARFGMGESQLETDRRIARKRIGEIKKQLKKVQSSRKTQRSKRTDSGIYRVALVGYTNAGKSTLLNALTGADVLAYDKLFATLDSTTRILTLDHGREVTCTDTVGFINKLPHELVEAFKSTLEEVIEADLLLHVIDASSNQIEAQIRAVEDVIDEIGAGNHETLMVLNKCDLVEDSRLLAQLSERYPESLQVSALTAFNLENLKRTVNYIASQSAPLTTVIIPFNRGELVEIAHSHATIIDESYKEDGTHITMRLPIQLQARFQDVTVTS